MHAFYQTLHSLEKVPTFSVSHVLFQANLYLFQLKNRTIFTEYKPQTIHKQRKF